MKILLCLASVLLLIAAPLHAQKPVVELPELQEWYSLSEVGVGISYLPGFSSDGGMNAIAVHISGDPTWYNRFPYDTVNKFSWSKDGTYLVVQVDLNGDGIMDYVDSRGFVYKGITKNQPPEKVAISQPIEHLNMSRTITGDFNGDGYEDIISAIKTELSDGGNDIFILLLGNSDLTKTKKIIVSEPINNNECLIGAYVNKEGSTRILTYHLDSNRWEGFALYSLDFTGGQVSGDIKVTLTILDSFGTYLVPNEQPQYEEIFTSLYHSHKYKENTLVVERSTGGTATYRIENDKLLFVENGYLASSSFSGLTASVDGDDKEDFVSRGAFTRNAITRQGYFIISGNPADGGFPPRAFFAGECGNGTGEKVIAIGDVTGDGIGDIAFSGGQYGCLRIYKGIDWKVSVQEANSIKFTVQATEPNPIGLARTAILPITIESSGHYTLTLSDVSGKSITELFSGELPIGEQRLPLALKSYNLSGGFYLLRLSDGKNTRERGILITNQP